MKAGLAGFAATYPAPGTEQQPYSDRCPPTATAEPCRAHWDGTRRAPPALNPKDVPYPQWSPTDLLMKYTA